jgi:hypothetical protein
MFMTPTSAQTKAILDIITSYDKSVADLTPAEVNDALDKIYSATNIFDRWNESLGDIDQKYDAVDN